MLASPYHRARQTRQSRVPCRPWGPRVASLSCRTRWSDRSHGAALARPPRHARSSLFSSLALLSCRSWVTLQGQVIVQYYQLFPSLCHNVSAACPFPKCPASSAGLQSQLYRPPASLPPRPVLPGGSAGTAQNAGKFPWPPMPSVGNAPSLPRTIHNALVTPSSASSRQLQLPVTVLACCLDLLSGMPLPSLGTPMSPPLLPSVETFLPRVCLPPTSWVSYHCIQSSLKCAAL